MIPAAIVYSMSSAKVSRLVGDLSELGSENGTQFTWNTWIIIIFPNCHNCGYSPISDCQVGDTMSFPLCLVKNHNFYSDVLAVLVFVCIPASTIFRQLEVSLSLCTVQRLSLCGEVVARHWLRLIFCPARNMGPTCCQGDNETVRIGLETIGKRLNPMVNSRFPYFDGHFIIGGKPMKFPFDTPLIFDHRIPWRWGHTSEVLIPMPS